MARDSDLRSALDMISGRSRKGRKQRSGTAWYNVLIICFGPRVSPLLLKEEAVEITSLVALFVSPSRVYTFSAAAFPAFQLCCCFSLSHCLLLTLWPALTIKCMTTSFNARRKSIKQPSRRLYAVFQNVNRLSQLLRSHSSRLNLRSLPRSFLRLFRFSHLVFLRCQELNPRLRSYCPRPVRHSHHLHLDPVERHRLRGHHAHQLLENWVLLRNKLMLPPPIDLGLENLLRQCDVKEPVIQAFRVRGITDRFLFVALDETTEGLRNTCREALGVDTNLNFEQKLEFAKISKAWSSAKIAAETKEKIDAVRRAHGEPVQMLEGDWVSLIRAFKVKFGKTFTHPGYRLKATTNHPRKNFRILLGRAEPLTHVVSLQEEERQKALRPEPARSVGIHLDSSLSIQTQRRFMSSVPTTIEDLRSQQMRQPSRHLYRDLEVNTFSDFLDELLSDQNFLMESDDDEKLVIPPWNQCLSYEFKNRKGAVRFCMEEGFALKDALWHVLADKETPHATLDPQVDHRERSTRRVQSTEA